MTALPRSLRQKLMEARKRCTELGIRNPLELAAAAGRPLTLVQHIAEFGVFGHSASEFPELAGLPRHRRRAVAEFVAVKRDIEAYFADPMSFDGSLLESEKQRRRRAERTVKQAQTKAAASATRVKSRKAKANEDRDAIVQFMVARGYSGNAFRANGKETVLAAMKAFNCGETKVKAAIRHGQVKGVIQSGKKRRRVGKI